MWEKLTKFNIQNLVAVIAVVLSFTLAFTAMFIPLNQHAELLVNKVIDITLLGVIGWLFTKSKESSAKL